VAVNLNGARLDRTIGPGRSLKITDPNGGINSLELRVEVFSGLRPKRAIDFDNHNGAPGAVPAALVQARFQLGAWYDHTTNVWFV
jgi:hypothetical protein